VTDYNPLEISATLRDFSAREASLLKANTVAIIRKVTTSLVRRAVKGIRAAKKEVSAKVTAKRYAAFNVWFLNKEYN